jgi:hypothetical protein
MFFLSTRDNLKDLVWIKRCLILDDTNFLNNFFNTYGVFENAVKTGFFKI